MTAIVVAVDGPAGAGKSTVSRRLAAALGYRYVDTGAMYRVVGVLAAEREIPASDVAALAALCDRTEIEFVEENDRVVTRANGRDVSSAIRTAAAAQQASRVSAVPAVRERLVAKQRTMGAGGGVVMEGRDIGTVVFPHAQVKVFLTASASERARRRTEQLQAMGVEADMSLIETEIAERDLRDSSRKHAPLKQAQDAVLIETDPMTLEQVADAIVEIHNRKVGQ